MLSNQRRRVALVTLSDASTPLDLETCAELIAERESGVDATDESVRNRVAATLHHVHFPKLSEFGMIDYDADANRVESVAD
ncbi:hypothetical protein VB773_05260 [Haloarculaceae archaeon H-GB2-1]|nr:hypothetical protein [Haloarculaceae archaeon H-GB11]MEA5407043.1 hypothetical protein [Haloarculaceae archaeon H-GB2-1]